MSEADEGSLIASARSKGCVKIQKSLLLGVGIFVAGASLLVASVLFLTICVGGLIVGTPCTLVFHWPTLLPGLGSMFLGATLIGRSFRKRSWP